MSKGGSSGGTYVQAQIYKNGESWCSFLVPRKKTKTKLYYLGIKFTSRHSDLLSLPLLLVNNVPTIIMIMIMIVIVMIIILLVMIIIIVIIIITISIVIKRKTRRIREREKKN